MIIGEPEFFAIESVITEAYERLGLRELLFRYPYCRQELRSEGI